MKVKIKALLFVLFFFSFFVDSCVIDYVKNGEIVDLESNLPAKAVEVTEISKVDTQEALSTPEGLNSEGDILNYLQEENACLAPCIFGITPGITSMNEVYKITEQLRMEVNGNNAYQYKTHDGMKINIEVIYEDEIVKNVIVGITHITFGNSIIFSPNKLIEVYGVPEKINFSISMLQGNDNYSMVMYYPKNELIVEMVGDKRGKYKDGKVEICLLSSQFIFIRAFYGNNLEHPPLQSVSLESATSLTLDEFSNIMNNRINDGCVDFLIAAFN